MPRSADAANRPTLPYFVGQLAARTGDPDAAEEAFKRAIALLEALRAPLPAEEFRTAFAADKLTPYVELADFA